MSQNYLYLPYDLSNQFLYLIVSQNILIANLGPDWLFKYNFNQMKAIICFLNPNFTDKKNSFINLGTIIFF